MQLAFCIYKYFPFGGLQRDFLQVAKACQTKGHQIRIYVMAWQGERPDNMEIIIVPAKGFTNHGRNKSYYRWVQSHLQSHPVDVVVGFNKMPGLDVYFAGDTCFAEKVEHKGFFYKISNRCRHYLAYEKAVFDPNSHTKLMMLTKQQINNFIKYYQTPEQRFSLLPPGIAIDRKYHHESPAYRTQFRTENHIDDNDFLIVQIGSDFKRKGVDRSLDAIASLPAQQKQRVKYFVIGQDDAEPYLKQAQTLGISEQVKFFAGRNDVPHFLFAADLLLHPARQEAAGMVLIEALAAGLPVVVSGISGYAYHVDDLSQAGVVLSEPYQQKELNRVLLDIMQHPEKLSQWQQNAIYYGATANLYHLADRAADIILHCATDKNGKTS